LALKVHIGDNGLWKYFSKLSNRLRRALVRVMTKKLMVTLVELHDQKGETSLQHSTDLGFMPEWPNSSHSSVKTHENPPGIIFFLSTVYVRNKIFWSDEPQNQAPCMEETRPCLSSAHPHPHSKVWW